MRIQANRTYRLTQAGIRAVRAERSVPRWYRTILAMMDGDTPAERICEIFSAHTRKQVLAWLDELETLGFLADASPEPAKRQIGVEDVEVDLLMPDHRRAA